MTKSGATYYLAYDQVGSLRIVTDTAGNVVKQIDYDSFGNIIADSNTAFTVPLGFAGGLHDRDAGLVKFGYRDYDPETGRWTAKDPIGFAGGDADLYGYVQNNPINWIDPLGLYGSGSCTYYQQACAANGGGYECGLAQTACPAFPTGDQPLWNWSDCVRQCLQERHKERMPDKQSCSDQNNIDVGDNAYDHAACFSGCTANPENPYNPSGPNLPDNDVNLY